MLKLLQHTAVAAVFILSLNATAQTSEPQCTVGYSGIGAGSMLQTGRVGPYTLTSKVTYEKKLADGNVISGYAISHQMRDTQGRTRTEDPTSCRLIDGVPTWQAAISVFDPVNRQVTNWQVMGLPNVRKVATVISLPPPVPSANQSPVRHVSLQRTAAPQLAIAHNNLRDEQTKTEDLGRRNIAGLEAKGTRTTRIVPAGKEGNAQPLTSIRETWTSVQYGMVLSSVNDDPIYGKGIYEVIDFQPIEPDASSFQPPADYKVDEVHPTLQVP